MKRMTPQYLERPGYKIAYHATAGNGPTVMFCGGFRSDMNGTKALYFEAQCRARGQGFVRFDYSGHGQSGGAFEDGTIGVWTADALAVFDHITAGPVLLVGSSMGGWIALLIARARATRLAGMVGIAAAPDFTRDIEARLTPAQKEQLRTQGFVPIPSDYSPEPYKITRALLEDGRDHCLLDQELHLSAPLRLVQGMKDTDVAWQTAFRIKNAVQNQDVDVLLVETGDHRLARDEDLALIDAQIKALSGL